MPSPPLSVPIPLALFSVSAGFPSPAEDAMDRPLDLTGYLVEHPAATFFMRVRGRSMERAGIYDGDLLVVDRSLVVRNRDVVVAVVDGEFTCKRIHLSDRQLCAEADGYPPIPITEDVTIEGVVTYSVRGHRPWPTL